MLIFVNFLRKYEDDNDEEENEITKNREFQKSEVQMNDDESYRVGNHDRSIVYVYLIELFGVAYNIKFNAKSWAVSIFFFFSFLSYIWRGSNKWSFCSFTFFNEEILL